MTNPRQRKGNEDLKGVAPPNCHNFPRICCLPLATLMQLPSQSQFTSQPETAGQLDTLLFKVPSSDPVGSFLEGSAEVAK